MKRVPLLTTFYLHILLSLLSCSTHKVEPDGDIPKQKEETTFIFKQTTLYFGEEAEPYITVLDANTVVIPADAPQKLVAKPGEVIFVPFSSENPEGFMGKVKTVQVKDGAILVETEECSLEDVFEELHMNEEVSVGEYMDKAVDDDGLTVDCEAYIAPSETKASSLSISDAREIPFSNGDISGKIVIAASLSIKIDIVKGKIQDYDIILRKKSSISASTEGQLTGNGRKTLVKPKTFRIPVSIPVGPIVLRPAIVCSLDMVSSGQIKIGANFEIGIDDVCTRWHNGEVTTTHSDSNSTSFGAYYLDADGELGFEGRVALQFGVFGQKLLAFGIDAMPKVTVGLSGKVSMDNRDLLKKDFKANMVFEASLGVYLYCKLLSSKWDQLRASIDIPSRSFELGLFDGGTGLKIDKSGDNWKASGKFGNNKFMSIDERGLALFKVGEEEPIVYKPFNQDGTTKASYSGDVLFQINGNPFDYYIVPYNMIKPRNMSNKYYFYGKIVGDFIESIQVSFDRGDGFYYKCTLPFEYDEFGRLLSAGSYRYSYSKSGITITGGRYGFPPEATRMPQEWRINLDETGSVTGGACDISGSMATISPGFSSYLISDTDGRNYVNYSMENGNLKQLLEHGEAPMGDDQWERWNHYYNYSYGSYYNSLGTTDLVNYVLDDILPPFIMQKGIISKNLPKGCEFKHEHTNSPTGAEQWEYSYTLDDSGRIIAFKTPKLSGAIAYKEE